MSIEFRGVTSGAVRGFEAAAPDGVVVGLIGETGSGKDTLLRLAAGCERPAEGSVELSGAARLVKEGEEMAAAPVLLLDHALARMDAVEREKAAAAIGRMKRGGSTVLLVSNEEELMARLADEVWWIDAGKLAGRGDPAEMLAAWRRHVAARVRAWGQTVQPGLEPRMRRGDGRAEVVIVELIGEDGRPTGVWRSGELAVVKVTVRFRQAVADPVVGIMIRTAIGLNVYGTNTELEQLKLGPRAAGDMLEVKFAFRSELCPAEYTLTVASHDPDGVWHDWLEDAVAFAVSDTRYTAGVANLRATVSWGLVPTLRPK